MHEKTLLQKAESWLILILSAFAMGWSYELFVFPNQFAPAGFNGIATMIQYLFHFSIGFFSVLINVPLLLLGRRYLEWSFILRTALFVLVFSLTTLTLNQLDLSAFVYHTDNGTSFILGPITAGLINGTLYSVVLRRGGSTGGTDILAAMIQKKHPETSLVWVVFTLNAIVAGISYFVYHFQFEPVILCLIYCYLSSFVSNSLMKMGKRALKFEVITKHAEELSALLLRELHHGVTMLPAEGMFSGAKMNLLICVVNRYQIARFNEILSLFPDTFAYVSDVNETIGSFQRAALDPPRDKRVG